MIKKLSSRELALTINIMLLLTAAASVYGFINDFKMGIVILALGLILSVIHAVSTAGRLYKLNSISNDIDQILHGREEVRFEKYTEGETAILENEIYKMTVRLREQQQNLLSDKKYLADSLADISHQLRTPLTSMNLITSMLSAPECKEDKRRSLLRELNGLLSRIDWLITALLNISKLDAGTVKFRRETVSMREFLQKATMPMQIPMELRDQKLVIEAEGDFSGDIQWTGEALGNIVKNCMEHTPDGGMVTVTGSDNPIFTEIRIKDTGRGIAPDDLPHIFERFYRGKNSGDSSYGIGLALARKIVKSQNGTLKAMNSAKGGAEFEMRFYKTVV